MTAEEIRQCRILIKDNILHYLCDDWNNHKRGKAHKENQALFDREDGFACFYDIDLEMIMEKVVKGIWSADLEQLNEQNNTCFDCKYHFMSDCYLECQIKDRINNDNICKNFEKLKEQK